MMFGKKKSVAGLDIGSSSIKMVELEGKPNNLNLVSLGFRKPPGDTIIDGQIMELERRLGRYPAMSASIIRSTPTTSSPA